MQILPCHRVLKDANGLSAQAVLAKLTAVCAIEPAASPGTTRPHELTLYLGGQVVSSFVCRTAVRAKTADREPRC
jgi:hypothetical protein